MAKVDVLAKQRRCPVGRNSILNKCEDPGPRIGRVAGSTSIAEADNDLVSVTRTGQAHLTVLTCQELGRRWVAP